MVVVYGPRGVGKCELVRMFVKLRGYRYDENIIWLDASTKHNLHQSIHQLCMILDLSVVDHKEHKQVMDGVLMMKQVHQYFVNSKVLFVFQNVTSYQTITEYLPSTNNMSHTILTSTQRFCVRRFHHIVVNKLPLTSAEDFLKKALPIGDSFQAINLRQNLAKSLRFNPLALSLACGFVKHSGTATWDYICAVKTVVKEHIPKRLQDKKDKNLISEYTAFYLTCNALSENTLACFILNVASYLNGNNIDVSLIESILKHSHMFMTSNEFHAALDFLVNLSLIRFCDNDNKNNKTTTGKGKKISIHSSVQEVNRIYQTEYSVNKLHPFHCILDYMFRFSGYHQQRNIDCGSDWIHHFLHIFEAKYVHSHFLLKCKENQEFLFDVFSSKGLLHSILPIFKKIENICEKGSRDRYLVKVLIARSLQCVGQLGVALSEHEDVEFRVSKRFGEYDLLAFEAKFLRTFLVYKQKRYAATLDLCNELLTKLRAKISRTIHHTNSVEQIDDQPENNINASNDSNIENSDTVEDSSSSSNSVNTEQVLLQCEQLKLRIEFLALRCNDKSGSKGIELKDLESIEKKMLDSFQENHPNVFRIQYSIGKHHLKVGKIPEAITIFKKLELSQSTILGETHCDLLKTMNRLSECFSKLHDHQQSLSYLITVKDRCRVKYGTDHIKTLKSQLQYMKCLQQLGQNDEAYDVLSRVETVQQHNPVVYRAEDILHTKILLASHLQTLGYYDEALEKYQEILETQLVYYENEKHRDILKTKHYFASCLHEMGRLEEAMEFYKETERDQSLTLGEHHEDLIRTQHNLSVCLVDSCQEKKAFKELKEVEEKQKNSLTPLHPELLVTQTNLAICLHKRQYFERALKKYQDVLYLQQQHFGDRNLIVLTLKHHIAICMHDQGNLVEALTRYNETYNTLSALLGSDHPDTLRARYNRAICYFDSKKYRKAMTELESVEDIQADVLGENHADTLRTQTSRNVCERDASNILVSGPGRLCAVM